MIEPPLGVNRPDHPDFWKLSDIVLRLDGSLEGAGGADEQEAIWRRELERHVDVDSLGYMATQRAFRVLGIVTARDFMARKEEVIPMLQVYMDAFIMGCNFKESE